MDTEELLYCISKALKYGPSILDPNIPQTTHSLYDKNLVNVIFKLASSCNKFSKKNKIDLSQFEFTDVYHESLNDKKNFLCAFCKVPNFKIYNKTVICITCDAKIKMHDNCFLELYINSLQKTTHCKKCFEFHCHYHERDCKK